MNAESSLRSLPAAISRTARARNCVVKRRDLGARSRRATSARDLGGISARLGELAVEIGHLSHDANRQRRRLGIVGYLRPDDAAEPAEPRPQRTQLRLCRLRLLHQRRELVRLLLLARALAARVRRVRRRLEAELLLHLRGIQHIRAFAALPGSFRAHSPGVFSTFARLSTVDWSRCAWLACAWQKESRDALRSSLACSAVTIACDR